MDIEKDIKQIENFVRSLKKTDIVELVWEKDGQKLGFKKDENCISSQQESMQKTKKTRNEEQEKAEEGSSLPAENNYKTMKSKMVGTFYIAATADNTNYVNEGAEVKTGQKICVIEAMKVMREIKIDEDAKIIKILIENGHPVEYGQDMFLIEPVIRENDVSSNKEKTNNNSTTD